LSLPPGSTSGPVTVSVPVTSQGATVTSNVTSSSIPELSTANNANTATMGTQPVDVSATIAPVAGSLPVGSTYSATVTFTNLGSATVTFTPTYTVNGTSVPGTQSIILAPGAVTTTQAPVASVTTAGSTVTAGVGATSLPETTRTNNTATATVSPLQPDFTTTVVLPQNAPAGTTVTGTVTFSNTGNATATFTATITVNGVVVQTVTLSLPPGSTSGPVTVSVPVTSQGATVTSNVTSSSIPELSTANNLGTDSIQSLVSDISVTLVVPVTATPGQVVTASVVLTNTGAGPAQSITAILTLPNGSTISVVLGTVSLASGGSTSAIVTYTVPPAQTATMSWTVGISTTSTETTLTNNITVGTTTVVRVFNASVSGRVWLDSNSNRVYNPGVDSDLSGWRVELLQGNVVVGSATTGVNGTYTIPGQTPGAGYSIRFRNPAGQVIVATPFNQTPTTANGNASTGTTTSVVTGSYVVGGQIENVTLYAGDNVAEQNLPVDPSGVVYDAVTRQPVAGAQVTLIGPNGLVVPSSDLLGGNGSMTTDATGIYQFWLLPTAPAGNYRLEITPPAGYTATPAQLGGVAPPGIAPGTLPSQGAINGSGIFTPVNNIAFVNVQPNSGAPAVGVNGAGAVGAPGTQYFFQFNLTPGGANPSAGVLHNHIPLDPLSSGALLISKTGDKSVAEIGDSVRYTIRIRNTSNAPIAGVQVEDLLPAGFRYILGTARLNNNVLVDPAGGVGRALTFNLGSAGALTGSTTWELTYYVRLGVGSQQGDGINRATAVFNGVNGPVRSNTAQYRVRVQGGVFSNEGCIIGKVYTDCDGNSVQNNESGSRELGIPSVRLVMLDGTQITTDSEGKYSICGIKPQTHVIKVDRTTLPKGSRLLPSSNRNAGVGDSIFVDLKGGELARADFIEGSCSPEVLDQIKARRALGGVLAPEKEIAPDLKIDNRPPQAEQQILPGLRPESPAPANPGGKTP
jgi:large repetitive protein